MGKPASMVRRGVLRRVEVVRRRLAAVMVLVVARGLVVIRRASSMGFAGRCCKGRTGWRLINCSEDGFGNGRICPDRGLPGRSGTGPVFGLAGKMVAAIRQLLTPGMLLSMADFLDWWRKSCA